MDLSSGAIAGLQKTTGQCGKWGGAVVEKIAPHAQNGLGIANSLRTARRQPNHAMPKGAEKSVGQLYESHEGHGTSTRAADRTHAFTVNCEQPEEKQMLHLPVYAGFHNV